VLRRSNAAVSDRAQPVLRFERLEIDLECRDVLVDGDPVELTAREFDLLAFLASSPRQVFTRDQLLQQVWSSSSEWQDPRTIAEHVHRLRRKIEPDPSTPRWIQTLRGAGYRFTP
jgi:DNA-binding response OmpR family regulator